LLDPFSLYQNDDNVAYYRSDIEVGVGELYSFVAEFEIAEESSEQEDEVGHFSVAELCKVLDISMRTSCLALGFGGLPKGLV
jgi:hypothetical protein